ncbi:MAG: hypothetical protein QM747_22155 [Nocardioides sp.]
MGVNAQEGETHQEAHPSAETGAKKKFEIGKFALHHIADSHSWHVIGEKYIGLPVVLYSNGRLVTFNSADFNHDDNGKVVVEKGGQRFVKMHEKIYHASPAPNEHGQYVELDAQHHPHNTQAFRFFTN